jgi:hypothetical protein
MARMLEATNHRGSRREGIILYVPISDPALGVRIRQSRVGGIEVLTLRPRDFCSPLIARGRGIVHPEGSAEPCMDAAELRAEWRHPYRLCGVG